MILDGGTLFQDGESPQSASDAANSSGTEAQVNPLTGSAELAGWWSCFGILASLNGI